MERKEKEEEVCAICLESNSVMEENCMIWWCEHIYHRECMNKYMEYGKMSCPMCRMEIKNIVDLSDKIDIYIYKSLRGDDVMINEENLLLYKGKLDMLVENFMDGFMEENLVEDFEDEERRLLEEMILFDC